MLSFNHPKVHRLCQANNVSFLALFGSYARGTFSKQSDIDLLIRFDSAKGLLDVIRIERAFSRLFGKKVDLITERSVSPYMKPFIQKDVQVIYDRKK